MTHITKKITSELFRLSDEKYRDFHARLIPTVPKESIIGVRIPVLRKLAKGLSESDAKSFMQSVPHSYYDENTLHALLIGKIRNIDELFSELDLFLPYIDNWATCDSLRPAIFEKHPQRLICKIKKWLDSGHTYTVRFAIEMLMCHFLEDNFKEEYLEWVSNICSKEYYVKMMCAWFFAEALVKQYDSAVAYFENNLIYSEVFLMAVRKARESYRIDGEKKEYLMLLERKHRGKMEE